ncbi:MAG: hypothetical protein UT13_C0002G0009 [Candidatus Pacebacteria bacterium GW2011_GWF2_38_9]|nr:MAG: hypothetical protein UT13_C0002G0009 [Candidatus Pacebacteria bacterium GW2011_GWF2_38_9]
MTTYSFQDVNIIFNHPSVGQYIMNGQGIGSLSVSKAQTKTVHDIAADGNIMVSRIPGENGSVSITMQQISDFHAWLQKYYNYVSVAGASEWTRATIELISRGTTETMHISGVSPEKAADRPYQAQGQNVTWNFMATTISQMAV